MGTLAWICVGPEGCRLNTAMLFWSVAAWVAACVLTPMILSRIEWDQVVKVMTGTAVIATATCVCGTFAFVSLFTG